VLLSYSWPFPTPYPPSLKIIRRFGLNRASLNRVKASKKRAANWGGPASVAVALALKYPDLIRGLVLASGLSLSET
jgi:hypothetical protein